MTELREANEPPAAQDVPLSTEPPTITLTPKAIEMGKKQLMEASYEAGQEFLGLRLGKHVTPFPIVCAIV